MRDAFTKSTGGIFSYFARHRTAANLLMLVLVVMGLMAAPNMRAQFFPDVIIDNVSVTTTWEGAGAEDADRAILQVLEPVLLAVEGVESSGSYAVEGRASVQLEFEPGWDMARAADDVQAAVDTVTDLPEDAEDPVVRRGIWRDRVTDVVIHGPVSVRQLGQFADEFVSRLFEVGVTRTSIRGVAADNTVVEVPSIALIQHDVSLSDVAVAIAGEAATDPAGDLTGANARVRTGVAKREVRDIAGIVLRSNVDGSKLTIGDIATIRREGADRERAYFVGDNSAVSLRVDRSDQGDAIEIQELVEGVAAQMNEVLPGGTEITLIRTRSEAITGRLNILFDNGLVGLGLVVLLLFLFLNARTAFWVAAGLPVAMFGAIALMYLAGLTINMVSLFALIITLGIVVDDAIVVGEHADFRARNLGESPVEAAENAARRMASPVFAATITTIIAFFGLTAVGGRFGDLIADIPFTVIVVLIASLVECFLILPNHMAHALASAQREHWVDWPSRQVNKGFNWFRENLFRPLMGLIVWARYPVVAIALLLLASQVSLFIRGDVNWRFFNAPERGSVSGNFAMLPQADREDTLEMMAELRRATETVGKRFEEQYGTNPISFVILELGGNTGRGLSGTDSKDRDLLGSVAIELIDADLRPYTSFRFVGDLQDEVQRHPLLETVSFRGWRSGPGGDSLDVQLIGADAETMKAAAEALKTAVAKFPEVSAVEDNMAYDKQELVLELTPQGQALGFEIDGLARVLRNRLNGIEAAKYPDGPRSATIRVELPKSEQTADFLEKIFLRTTAGEYVPLGDVVSVTSKSGFSTVLRENGVQLISVTGDISEDDPVRAEEIVEELSQKILPEIEQQFNVTSQLSGLAEQEQEFLSDAMQGFVLCLVGIYLALAWVFASWTRPVVIMLIIPFGLIGTIYGHAAWDVPLSMFTIVGLIGMTGIIINDSIVLVSTVDEYRKKRGTIPAIIDGTCDRLRPVILTTLTTVLGLAPLLFETSRQAQFLKPTVITLCYGLACGLFIVLLVVPAFLAIQQDLAKYNRALRRMVRARSAAGAQALVGVGALGLTGLFAATVGATIFAGDIPDYLTGFVTVSEEGSPVVPVLGVFLAAAIAVLLLIWLVGIAMITMGSPRKTAHSP